MKKGDYFVIFILLFSSLFFIYRINTREDLGGNKYVSIQISGKEIEKIDLSKENIGKTFRYDQGDLYNIVEIGDGKVRIKEDNSPDQIAVMQSWKTMTGETLVCLPHKFVVEIKSDTEISDIDHVNY